MAKKNKNSDTLSQREAEKKIIEKLNNGNSWDLIPQNLTLKNGQKCQIDGVDHKNKILCEVSARIGTTSASRDKKMVSDSAKMVLAEQSLKGKWRKILVFVDSKFASNFDSATSSKWQAEAINHLGVEVLVQTIPSSLKTKIVAAQKKQGEKFKK